MPARHDGNCDSNQRNRLRPGLEVASRSFRKAASRFSASGSSVDLRSRLDDVADVIQGGDDSVEIDLLVVEANRHRVLIHVGLDRGDVVQLFDGRTGRRGGAASNDAGRAEHVGDGACLGGGDPQQHAEYEQSGIDDLSCSHDQGSLL